MENKTEPLYETKTDFSLKLYMKACKTSARKPVMLCRGIICLYFVGRAVIDFSRGNSERAVITLIVLAVSLFLLSLLFSLQIKKSYKSYEKITGSEINYKFYADCFESITKSGESRFLYSEIHKIKEHKDFFCIYAAKNLFNVLDKKSCSEELANFIREIKEKK
ncbi:MAG: YcxB family protein [Clostridiales bacterium]|nr:YcxB family protein [Clostridiales bacterium]